MDELFRRQFLLIQQSIDDYRTGRLSLNSMIQRIEGACRIINIDQWKNAVSVPLFEMEQINADVLNAGTNLSDKDKSDLEKFLLDIEKLIVYFESTLAAEEKHSHGTEGDIPP